MSDEHESPTTSSEAASAEASDSPADAKDVVMIHSQHDDGQGYNVLRMRDGSLEMGAIRNIREGVPVHGDIVSLSQRKEHERLYNVEVLVKSPARPEAPRHGPAQVATDAYRTNWENIFGKAGTSSGGSDAPN